MRAERYNGKYFCCCCDESSVNIRFCFFRNGVCGTLEGERVADVQGIGMEVWCLCRMVPPEAPKNGPGRWKGESTMQITVTGKQIEVGNSLQQYVQDHLTDIVKRFFDNPMECTVTFSREAHTIKADIIVHVGRGILVQASDTAVKPYPAFDAASGKLTRQLRKYKSKLREHHQREAQATVEMARKVILEGAFHDDAASDSAEQAADHVVIAEMETRIDTLTPADAVMRMDLGNLPAVMFRNPTHGGLNMVYRRPDGNVGWVDPRGTNQDEPAVDQTAPPVQAVAS